MKFKLQLLPEAPSLGWRGWCVMKLQPDSALASSGDYSEFAEVEVAKKAAKHSENPAAPIMWDLLSESGQRRALQKQMGTLSRATCFISELTAVTTARRQPL